jgi:hypothetical protein
MDMDGNLWYVHSYASHNEHMKSKMRTTHGAPVPDYYISPTHMHYTITKGTNVGKSILNRKQKIINNQEQ